MALFSWLKGNKGEKQNVEEPGQLATATIDTAPPKEQEITYKDDLIPKLKADHQALFALFSRIVTLTISNRYDEIPSLLNQLKMAFQAHVLVENVHLYVYLEKALQRDAFHQEFMRELRYDMNDIGREVMKFVKRYDVASFDEDLKSAFKNDLDTVGKVLTQRVQIEEAQLYTLYQPSTLA